MNWFSNTHCNAFEGSHCIASGELRAVALIAKCAIDRGTASLTPTPVLIFVDATSEVVELDWRGTAEEFAARLVSLPHATDESSASSSEDNHVTPEPARGPGRPRLGVVPREVTLLPRHWEWLGSQTGGASVALRKLVEAARRASETKDRVRHASAVGYKFMSTMAGHEPGFEEASRALFAGSQGDFEALIAAWPMDVQLHLKKILAAAFCA